MSGQYWLRVHGYPGQLDAEVVYYSDFYDLATGQVLPSDPCKNLRPGDTLIYFADGPGSVYGVATVTGEVEGPLSDARRGQVWRVPTKREAIIRAVYKAPHAAWMEPPSGRHFLAVVRDYTYIRLLENDALYLIDQVKARASARDS